MSEGTSGPRPEGHRLRRHRHATRAHQPLRAQTAASSMDAGPSATCHRSADKPMTKGWSRTRTGSTSTHRDQPFRAASWWRGQDLNPRPSGDELAPRGGACFRQVTPGCVDLRIRAIAVVPDGGSAVLMSINSVEDPVEDQMLVDLERALGCTWMPRAVQDKWSLQRGAALRRHRRARNSTAPRLSTLVAPIPPVERLTKLSGRPARRLTRET